jgi:hypothetical protein
MRLFNRIREALSIQGGKKRKKLSDRPHDDADEEEIEELIALDII